MDLQDLIAWTVVAAGGFFLYFNLVEIAAESFGKWLVHKWNMKIQAEKIEEARVEELCDRDYRAWLHQDPCWIGE